MRRHQNVVLIVALIGGTYGLIGSLVNINPYTVKSAIGLDEGVSIDEALGWEPSPVWLPSYLTYTWHIGVKQRKGFWYFPSPAAFALYMATSTFLGLFAFAPVGAGAHNLVRSMRDPDGSRTAPELLKRHIALVILLALAGAYGCIGGIATRNPCLLIGGTLREGSSPDEAREWRPSRLWAPGCLAHRGRWWTVPAYTHGSTYRRRFTG